MLQEYGIQTIPAEGLPFDPLVHEAVMQEYNADVPDGTVLVCLQKGYRMVKVRR